jgi:putative ABC transport system permease protein
MRSQVGDLVVSLLRQVSSITLLNLSSIRQRLGSSVVVVVGIAGAAGVLVTVFGMVQSLSGNMLATAREDRAIVLRREATSEVASSLTPNAVALVADAPGVARTADGKPAISPDLLTAVNLARKADGTRTGVVLRGVGPQLLAVRPEIRIVEGNFFRPGLRELIVGRGVRSEFESVEVGKQLTLRDGPWTVVGVFQSGDANDGAIFADSATLLSAYRRTLVSSVTVRLQSPEIFERFRDSLTANPEHALSVMLESDYYEQQASSAEGLLRIVTLVVGSLMTLGAVFAALNTMHSAVAARTVEIATLRAIGFGRVGVVASILIEAMLLSLLGAALGAGSAWLLFHGTVITMGKSVGSAIFQLEVGPVLFAAASVLACAVGMLGGLMPAIHAIRMPVAAGLRAN